MLRVPALLLSTLTLLAAQPAQAASHQAWATASTVGRDALVVAALGLPIVKEDWKGTGQAALSIGASYGATAGLKYVVQEERPDGSDDNSFPSGHTSVSFAAAATLEKRYGWQVGLPAHALAAFVGVARVQADKHFWHDVIAGAAIGEASGWLLTSRHDSKVRRLPWGDAHGGGAEVSLSF